MGGKQFIEFKTDVKGLQDIAPIQKSSPEKIAELVPPVEKLISSVVDLDSIPDWLEIDEDYLKKVANS